MRDFDISLVGGIFIILLVFILVYYYVGTKSDIGAVSAGLSSFQKGLVQSSYPSGG